MRNNPPSLSSLHEALVCAQLRARFFQIISSFFFFVALCLPLGAGLWLSKQNFLMSGMYVCISAPTALSASIGWFYLWRSMALLERVDALRALKLILESGYKVSPQFIMKFWTALPRESKRQFGSK